MNKALMDRLCDQVSVTEMMRHLEVFARRMKYSGTPEELESFLYLQEEMRRYGYRTTLLSHDAYISLPGDAHVEVQGQNLACITHSFSRSSPPNGLRGKLVHVGKGRVEDFAGLDVAGKIVLAEGLATPAVSMLASRAGALGQLHASPDEHLHEMIVSPVWGSPTHETVANLPDTVVCTISGADGARLRDRLAAGETIEANLSAKVDTGWRKTPLLVAELPGSGASEDDDEQPFVLLSGHHDTWHYGLMDNGAANATMLEVARICARERKLWAHGLRVAFWSGHSHGRYSGSSWYADAYWDDLNRRCLAHVNVDSTGGVGNTDLTHAMTSSELIGVARLAIREQGGGELQGRRLGRGGDQSFFGIGIPAMYGGVGEQPPGTPMHGKFPHPLGWWWHTPGDTLDKIDPEILVRDTRIYVHTIWQLLSVAVPPLDFAENARRLVAELETLSGALAERFDLSGLLRRTRDLHSNAETLRRRLADPLSSAAVEEARGALLAVSRALVPIEYSRGDRFEQDPALMQPAFPPLQPLRELCKLQAEEDAAKFLSVSAMRACNRIGLALDTANSALEKCLSRLDAEPSLAAE